MTAQTATIADFLLARIAEDEAVARRSYGSHSASGWRYQPNDAKAGGRVLYGASVIAEDWHGTGFGGVSEHIARHDPARVLAECEAKRRIVRQLDLFLQGDEQDPVGADEILLALAQPYADHPDFRPEWRA